MHLDIDRLRTFVAVAESGSFSRAAARVHRVQSAVSWQIKQLEMQVGRALFERTPIGVKLTDSGYLFLRRARELIGLSEFAVAEQQADAPVSHLVIGTSDVFAHSLLPEVLTVCRRHLGEVSIQIVTDYSATIWSMLDAGQIDVALTQDCPGPVMAHDLMTTDLCWVAANAHTHTDDVVHLACFTEGCTDRPRIFRAIERHGLSVKVAYSSASYGAILASISSDHGVVAAVPRVAVEKRMHVLDAHNGMPALERVTVSLAVNQRRNRRSLETVQHLIADYFDRGRIAV